MAIVPPPLAGETALPAALFAAVAAALPLPLPFSLPGFLLAIVPPPLAGETAPPAALFAAVAATLPIPLPCFLPGFLLAMLMPPPPRFLRAVEGPLSFLGDTPCREGLRLRPAAALSRAGVGGVAPRCVVKSERKRHVPQARRRWCSGGWRQTSRTQGTTAQPGRSLALDLPKKRSSRKPPGLQGSSKRALHRTGAQPDKRAVPTATDTWCSHRFST